MRGGIGEQGRLRQDIPYDNGFREYGLGFPAAFDVPLKIVGSNENVVVS